MHKDRIDLTLALQIRAFRATENPRLCREIADFHDEALSRHAVDGLHAADRMWMSHANTFAIVAEQCSTGRPLAGIRLQLADGQMPIPTEVAIGEFDQRLTDEIAADMPSTGEICGLWRATGVKNSQKLIVRLSIASMALAHRLGLRRVWGLAPEHTLCHWKSMGYRVDKRFGVDGGYPYPDDRYCSRVVTLDTEKFANTPQVFRRRILSFELASLLTTNHSAAVQSDDFHEIER